MKNKKYLLFIFILLIIFGVKEIYSSKDKEIILGDIKYVIGDANGNGKLDSGDYIMIRQHLLNVKKMTSEEMTRADSNYDDIISAVDYIYVRKTMLNSYNKYTVSFDSSGGSVVNSQIINSGNKVSIPTKPTKEGYTFLEWQLNGEEYNFGNIVNSDINLVAVWIKLDKKTYDMATNSEEEIKYTVYPDTNVNLTFKSNYKDYADVENNGKIHAYKAGYTDIDIKANNKKIGTIDVVIDYGLFDTCSTSKSHTKNVVKTTKGKDINIYSCIENQKWFTQGFAITNDSIIYTGAKYQTWCSKDDTYTVKKYSLSGECNSEDSGVAIATSGNYIKIYNKKTGMYDANYIDVGGHGQSFDATSSNEIYINYFPKVYLSSTYGYGSHTTGVAYINKLGKHDEYIYPTKAIRFLKNGNIELYNSSYQKGTMDYFNDVIDKAKEENTLSTTEIAVDEDHNQIAVYDKGNTSGGNKILYIYKLSDFKNGKKTLLGTYYLGKNMCTSDCGEQGIDLYGDYLYGTYETTINGKHYEGVSRIKYKTCSQSDINSSSCNMERLHIPGDTIGTEYGKGVVGLTEIEGVSIYKGKVYVSVITNYFSDGYRRNVTLLLDGFEKE